MAKSIFYVTKYWATQGILESKGENWTTDDGKRAYVYLGSVLCRIGSEAFPTLVEAEDRVRVLAAKKVKTLKKQLEYFEAVANGGEV